MAIDTKRIRDRRERARSRRKSTTGDLLKFAEGETKCLLHPSSRPDDTHPETAGLNFVEVVLHRNLGGKRNMQLCLDVKNNPILTHPDLVSFLASRKKNPIKLSKQVKCPTCRRIEGGELVGKAADVSKPSIQWFFGFTPMYFRKPDHEFTKMKFTPSPYISGVTIFDQATAEIERLAPADPTDLDAATLFIVERVGSDFMDTEYSVKADIESIRKPVKLDKAQRKLLNEAIEPGGHCDLIRVVSNFVKTPGQMEALMAGVAVTDEQEEAENEAERKECFGESWSDDDECNACSDSGECKSAMSDGEVEDHEEEAPKEEEAKHEKEDPTPPRRRKTRKNKEQDPEPEPEPEPEIDTASIDCWGEWEGDDPGCQECDVQSACKAAKQEPSDEPAEEQPADTESDPDLDAMEKEALEVASRKRRGKGKRK